MIKVIPIFVKDDRSTFPFNAKPVKMFCERSPNFLGEIILHIVATIANNNATTINHQNGLT